MGCALPSISTTSWPSGVSDCSRNIQRWGIKLRVTPLSGLYSNMRMQSSPFRKRSSVLGRTSRDLKVCCSWGLGSGQQTRPEDTTFTPRWLENSKIDCKISNWNHAAAPSAAQPSGPDVLPRTALVKNDKRKEARL